MSRVPCPFTSSRPSMIRYTCQKGNWPLFFLLNCVRSVGLTVSKFSVVITLSPFPPSPWQTAQWPRNSRFPAVTTSSCCASAVFGITHSKIAHNESEERHDISHLSKLWLHPCFHLPPPAISVCAAKKSCELFYL